MLRGVSLVQLVAHWITDHYHLSSNLGVGISEGCFIFDFASLPLDVVRPIQPTICTKVAVKHRSSSSSSEHGERIGVAGCVFIDPQPLFSFPIPLFVYTMPSLQIIVTLLKTFCVCLYVVSFSVHPPFFSDLVCVTDSVVSPQMT